jgi:predicted RNase H-like nuclease
MNRARTATLQLILCAAVLATAAACDNRSRDRNEAGKVLFALERVRAAPNEGKRRPADELSRAACSSPLVCGARDSCAEVYRHLAIGTETALRVKEELDKLEKEPAADPEKVGRLSSELDRADTEINDARDGMHRCEEAASLMRRTFGI